MGKYLKEATDTNGWPAWKMAGSDDKYLFRDAKGDWLVSISSEYSMTNAAIF